LPWTVTELFVVGKVGELTLSQVADVVTLTGMAELSLAYRYKGE
jgi:hypothetical protein